MTTIAEAAAKLAGADPVLVTCHLGPDGDSIGSMVALGSLLREQGRQVTLYCPDLVPRHLKWLPLCRSFVQKLRKGTRYALTVVVDCGDAKLLGPSFPDKQVTGDLLVLDHHASGRPFGEMYLCDPAASSVGVLVARIARELGWPISEPAGKGLYVSLMTDTGSFRYANTNAEAFALAAELVGRGVVDPWMVSEKLSEQGTVGRLRLLARVLDTLEVALDGKVALLTVTDEMVKASSAAWDDTDGFVNYARALKGVDCGILISPAKRGGTRVSMRSKGHFIDAGSVCLRLGGGGHKGAAGCNLESTDLAVAKQTVLEALATEIAASTAIAEAAAAAATAAAAAAAAVATDPK